MDESVLFTRCLDRLFSGASRHEFLIDELHELAEDLRESSQVDVHKLVIAQINRLTELIGHQQHPNTLEARFALRVLYSRYFVNSGKVQEARRYLQSMGLVVAGTPVLQDEDETYYFFYAARSQQHGDTKFSMGEIIPIVLRETRMQYYETVLNGFRQTQPRAGVEYDDPA